MYGAGCRTAHDLFIESRVISLVYETDYLCTTVAARARRSSTLLGLVRCRFVAAVAACFNMRRWGEIKGKGEKYARGDRWKQLIFAVNSRREIALQSDTHRAKCPLAKRK